tara:strand:- start:1700 stop:2320 length:621 start_codon:yes stop_codon:yes gene_type:complete
MPLLSITLRGTELTNPQILLLERPYNFTKLKLQHIYHNIDSIHFESTADKTNQCLLYLKLGGLVDNHKQIINYSGDYSTSTTHSIQHHYDNADHQLAGDTIAVNDVLSASVGQAQNRVSQAIDVDHLIPIGATKCDSKEMISRDLFKTLHDGGILNFDGEVTVSLSYMNHLGDIAPITQTTGGIQIKKNIDVHVTYFTLVFEYEEV